MLALVSACAIPDAECLSAEDCAAGEVCTDLRCASASSVAGCGGANDDLGVPCGTCGLGVTTCEEGEVQCIGDAVNPCGGCGPIVGWPGAPCGTCGGIWTCSGGATVCSASANACGGCASLSPAEASLGQVCDVGAGIGEGIWLCAGPDAIACRAPGTNACGGSLELDGVPGEACGPCLQGARMCVGTDAVTCCYGSPERCGDEAAPLDACGGCSNVALDAVGTGCGACGRGEWALDCAAGKLTCQGDSANACGGCAPLALEPGQPCGPGEVVACLGPESVACVATTARNACGGDTVMEASPGEACGPCDDGRIVCAGPDALVCVGASSRNECGGCGALDVPPGGACGVGRRWACAADPGTGEPAVVCAADPALDACGGVSAVPQRVWDPCGECGGRWGCEGTTLRCVVGDEFAPRTQYVDADRDGFGDERDPGSSICGGTEGYSERTGDCDDTRADVNPDELEVPGNGRDDDCNPSTPD